MFFPHAHLQASQTNDLYFYNKINISESHQTFCAVNAFRAIKYGLKRALKV